MNKAYLLTGGNLGSREKNLDHAKKLIERHTGTIIKTSSLYQTEAWGKTDQDPFLNQAIEIETGFSPKELMLRLLDIEKEIGRIRTEKYGPRIIDIDILLFNDTVLNDPMLCLPHPELQNRRFALAPLQEIAPQLIHPVLKKSISELLAICPDKLTVLKWTSDKS